MKLILAVTTSASAILLKGSLRYYRKSGYEVYVLSSPGSSILHLCENEGAILLPVKMSRDINVFKDFISLIQVYFILKKIKPDIVNYGTPKASFLVSLASYLARVPVLVYTCRGFRFESEIGLKRYILIFIEKLICKISDKVLFISNSLINVSKDFRITNVNKIELIGKGSSNGIDLNYFNTNNLDLYKLDELKIKYHLANNNIVIGFIGRLTRDKGIYELIEAFELLQVLYSQIKLIIIGQDELNKADKCLKQRIEQNTSILNLGYLNDINYHLPLFKILVVPTYREGFGNVFIQASAMGIPVVSCNVSGVIDSVINNETGILVSPKSSSQIVSAINYYLTNSSIYSTHSTNGLKWSKNFSSDYIWSSLNNLYKKLYKEKVAL